MVEKCEIGGCVLEPGHVDICCVPLAPYWMAHEHSLFGSLLLSNLWEIRMKHRGFETEGVFGMSPEEIAEAFGRA